MQATTTVIPAADIKPLIQMNPEEIKRTLESAFTRRTGLLLCVRQMGEKAERMIRFKVPKKDTKKAIETRGEDGIHYLNDVEVRCVEVCGATLKFCVENMELRVIGVKSMQTINSWLKRASADVENANQPKSDVLFLMVPCRSLH